MRSPWKWVLYQAEIIYFQVPLGILFILYAFIFEAAWALSNKSKVSSLKLKPNLSSIHPLKQTFRHYSLTCGFSHFLLRLPNSGCNFLWNCCRRRRKSVRSSFQVWANPVVAKKPRAGGFLLFWPFANFWIWNLLFWIWNLHFGNLRCPMINYHPQRGRADASDWAPLLQPQRSRDEANFEQRRWEISNSH